MKFQGTSTDQYVEILLPPEQMLRVCAQCATGEYLREEDEDFLHVLLAHMVSLFLYSIYSK